MRRYFSSLSKRTACAMLSITGCAAAGACISALVSRTALGDPFAIRPASLKRAGQQFIWRDDFDHQTRRQRLLCVQDSAREQDLFGDRLPHQFP